MFEPGLCSITFRKLDPPAIVELAASAGLRCIEWGSDVHAPVGDFAIARQVAGWTQDAGLGISSYGSYFKAGVEREADAPSFDAVLETATALGAPVIRVWAGAGQGPGGVPDDPAMFDRAVDELREAGRKAATAGVRLGIEYHAGSFTATAASATRLMEAVTGGGEEEFPGSVGLYWQPNQHAAEEATRLASLEKALPHLIHLHVFHWVKHENRVKRMPLEAGADLWHRRLAMAARAKANSGTDHAALLEFVADDDLDRFREDAATLVSMTAQLS